MAKSNNEKQNIRNHIQKLKAEYTPSDLELMSDEVFSVVEITGYFQNAKTIFLYNSLSDEVATQSFIQKWHKEKQIYLPVVVGDNIEFRKYNPDIEFTRSSYGIGEQPEGEIFNSGQKVDLVIVPGVAFDRHLNRLGRGKGFYDRFLSSTKATKMGVCFDFQLLDKVPTDQNDIKMDTLVSENDFIW